VVDVINTFGDLSYSRGKKFQNSLRFHKFLFSFIFPTVFCLVM